MASGCPPALVAVPRGALSFSLFPDLFRVVTLGRRTHGCCPLGSMAASTAAAGPMGGRAVRLGEGEDEEGGEKGSGCHKSRGSSLALDRSGSLPAAFLKFLEENGLDARAYAGWRTRPPRYVRLKGGLNEGAAARQLEAELGTVLQPVPWLPGFFGLPPDVAIARSASYRTGKVFGIDAASGAAVTALQVVPGDHVLDLCAAPGAKLCMIADLLGDTGTLTGVDVSAPRLAACRTMIVKYGLADRCRLFLGDGTHFCTGAPLPPNSSNEENADINPRQRAPWWSVKLANPKLADPGPLQSHVESTRHTSQHLDVGSSCSPSQDTPESGYANRKHGRLLTNSKSAAQLNTFRESNESTVDCICSTSEGPGTPDIFRKHCLASRHVQEDNHDIQGCRDQKESEIGDRDQIMPAAICQLSNEAGSTTSWWLQSPRRSRKERRRARRAKQFGHLNGGEADAVQAPRVFFVGTRVRSGWSINTSLAVDGAEEIRYDKVLVDAECTHDGSVRHIEKFSEWGWDTFERRVLDPQRVSSLARLQMSEVSDTSRVDIWHRLFEVDVQIEAKAHVDSPYQSCCANRILSGPPWPRSLPTDKTLPLPLSCAIKKSDLLATGFRLLRVHGFLIYSTCSLTQAQNEDIVQGLLDTNCSAVSSSSLKRIPNGTLLAMSIKEVGPPVPDTNLAKWGSCLSLRNGTALLSVDGAEAWPCKAGLIPKTLLFDPASSRTSGLFIAKLTKLAHACDA